MLQFAFLFEQIFFFRQLTKSSNNSTPIQPKRVPVLPVRESPVPSLNLPPQSDEEDVDESLAQSFTESARDAELDAGKSNLQVLICQAVNKVKILCCKS